jgi:hypothetical protein
MDVPELDELTFRPTTWDLAMSIGLIAEPETDRGALAELADAMLVWADETLLDSLTDAALPRLWDGEIEAAVREGLVRVAEKPEWSAAASEAIEALDGDSGRSEIAREVVRHLAMQLGQADQPFFACLCCIDDGLETVEPSARREEARRAAVLARRNADISDTELRAAISQLGSTDPVEALGTPERREAVRRRLARLGRLGSTSMPALAAELTKVGAEPLPAVPAEDDVWVELCTWMLEDAAAPDLN